MTKRITLIFSAILLIFTLVSCLPDVIDSTTETDLDLGLDLDLESDSGLTDEQFFKTVCLKEGNKWNKTSGFATASDVPSYTKYFKSGTSVTDIKLSFVEPDYIVSDYTGSFGTDLYMTVNSDWLSGTIYALGYESDKLNFTIDRDAETLTVSKDSNTAVFTLKED